MFQVRQATNASSQPMPGAIQLMVTAKTLLIIGEIVTISWENGCETSLNNTANCGACANQCGNDKIYQDKRCIRQENIPPALLTKWPKSWELTVSLLLA